MLQRTRWSAVGAAVAVVLGAGVVLPSANAAISGGTRAVFVSIEPCRLFDTRSAPVTVGPRSTPIGPEESYTQQVTGSNGHCEIPTDATAISMNVTTVDGTAASYLTLYPANAPALPQASNLNWTAGAPPTPNKVDVRLSDTGAVKVYNNAGSVNVHRRRRRVLRGPQPRRPLLHEVGDRRERQRHDAKRGVRPVGGGVGATSVPQPGILNGCHGNVGVIGHVRRDPHPHSDRIPIDLGRRGHVRLRRSDHISGRAHQIDVDRVHHSFRPRDTRRRNRWSHSHPDHPAGNGDRSTRTSAMQSGWAASRTAANAFCQATVVYDTKP